MNLRVPLAFLSENKQATVVKVVSGSLVRQLYALDFTPGR